MTPLRGDIWLIDFGQPIGREQAGQRPAVVISADWLNESRAGVHIVVPCTSTRRELNSHVEIDEPGSGLTTVSYAKCEDIKSISERRLVTRVGSVGPEVLFDISRRVQLLIDA